MPVWTATVRPHRSSREKFFGFPRSTAKASPAWMYWTMLACAIRSALMVNDEMPTSYVVPTAGMMSEKLAVRTSAFSPSTVAMALAKSTS